MLVGPDSTDDEAKKNRNSDGLDGPEDLCASDHGDPGEDDVDQADELGVVGHGV